MGHYSTFLNLYWWVLMYCPLLKGWTQRWINSIDGLLFRVFRAVLLGFLFFSLCQHPVIWAHRIIRCIRLLSPFRIQWQRICRGVRDSINDSAVLKQVDRTKTCRLVKTALKLGYDTQYSKRQKLPVQLATNNYEYFYLE